MKKIALAVLLAGVTSLMAADGASLYKKCISCHGMKAEKAAKVGPATSAIIGTWSADKIANALKGYKAGTYGGAMKALMKGQVASYSDADIDTLAKYIAGLK